MKRALVLLIVCAVSVPMFGDDVTKAIRAMADSFEEGIRSGKVDLMMSIYADDAVLMPPNAPAMRGRDAIRQFWSGMLAAGKADLDITIETVDVSGDMAAERGTWSLSMMPNGANEAMKDHGKYVIVWRNVGGKWRAMSDIYNSDVAMTK